jgi:DNA polymerase
MLKLRLLMAKTSVKKYQAIERSVCSDGRVHGLLQFYGANRTGRWAGRLVQVQNLPQNHIPDLGLARDLIKKRRFEDIDLLYDSTPGVLSELIRTAFVPRPGCRFIVADFSAIEARVIAWLSGENWRLDVFKTHGRIYEASASAMFGVPIEQITKGSPLRQKGKIAELALGYGGSVGALTAMGALDMGLTEEELQPLVNQWRAANPHITKYWWDCDAAAFTAVQDKTEATVGRVTFSWRSGILFITLPSGRKLSYIKPRLATNRFGRTGLTYEGVGESKKRLRIETYGPKLVENIVQATARDLLAEGMLRLRNAGFDIVMHVHDEAVIEVPHGASSVEEVCRIMAEAPAWADGLPLRADGYECDFYKKD